jgi:hypothetical protein
MGVSPSFISSGMGSRDGCPGGESAGGSGRSGRSGDRPSESGRGRRCIVRARHVLRVLVARRIGLSAGAGQHFLLDTGTLCHRAAGGAGVLASRVAIIAAGSLASDRAVKSRRSAQGSTARIVSPAPRRLSAPAPEQFVVDSPLEGAVLSELALQPNSLLAGKIQGISSIFAQSPSIQRQNSSSSLYRSIPCANEQGIFRGLSGN